MNTMLQISSFEGFDEVISNLHDCPFDLDRVVFDAATETWRGTFLRPLWDDPRAQHRGLIFLYLQSQLPVAEATLTIVNVKNYSVVDAQGIGRYSVTGIGKIPNGVRLSFNEALHIDFDLGESISATYEERVVADIRAIYRQYFLMQTGPKIVRVLQSNAG
jgi:hypothetical protein